LKQRVTLQNPISKITGKGELHMKEIFEQYGGAIITVIAVVALAAMITMVIGTDSSSPVYQAFQALISSLGGKIK
jgi:hypothetical protein